MESTTKEPIDLDKEFIKIFKKDGISGIYDYAKNIGINEEDANEVAQNICFRDREERGYTISDEAKMQEEYEKKGLTGRKCIEYVYKKFMDKEKNNTEVEFSR
jgi:hypothetical protein